MPTLAQFVSNRNEQEKSHFLGRKSVAHRLITQAGTNSKQDGEGCVVSNGIELVQQQEVCLGKP